MQIIKKRIEAIKELLKLAITAYVKGKYELPEICERFIVKLQEILTPESRSIAEQRLYWVQLNFIAQNIPEIILKMWDVESVNAEMIHELFKNKFKVSSTAFNAMEQDVFNEYHNKCIEWASMFFWRMSSEKFNTWFNSVK